MWSDENLVLAAILLDEEATLKSKVLVHNILTNINVEGEYKTLLREVIDAESNFPQFNFYELLSSIEPVITKQNNRLREAISANQTLCVSLK